MFEYFRNDVYLCRYEHMDSCLLNLTMMYAQIKLKCLYKNGYQITIYIFQNILLALEQD